MEAGFAVAEPVRLSAEPGSKSPEQGEPLRASVWALRFIEDYDSRANDCPGEVNCVPPAAGIVWKTGVAEATP
jgi:hypothetical protein